MSRTSRRGFLKQSAAVGVLALAGPGCAISGDRRAASVITPRRGPNEEIRVAVVGFHGQGKRHIREHAKAKNVRVVTLCDVDENQWPIGLKLIDEAGEPKPKTEYDIRRVLDDKDVDCISIATPNHWHALATVWACQAGKDVYVEKPGSHNLWEGRQMIKAARKYNRIVQHGTHGRSCTAIREAIQQLHAGVIGEVYMARAICFKNRDSVGIKPDQNSSPPGVHYGLWLGPAPKRPFNENRFIYQWHWNWDYGNGDIGNQGVHQIDIARWGLKRKLPAKVSSMGGRFTYEDQGQTPNTQVATMQYEDGTMLVVEVRGRQTHDEYGCRIGNIFYGSKGYLAISNSYRSFKTMVDGQPGPSVELPAQDSHFPSFHEAVRSRNASGLNAEIEEGHYSSAICHMANISYRLGRSLEFDPKTEKFKNDRQANAMLSRNYRKPFVIPERV